MLDTKFMDFNTRENLENKTCLFIEHIIFNNIGIGVCVVYMLGYGYGYGYGMDMCLYMHV